MTKAEAVNWLINITADIGKAEHKTLWHYEQALCEIRDMLYAESNIAKELAELPSAEPQIIRCKDCKWWDKKEDSRFGYCHAIKHGYYTSHWEISIHRTYEENFYCADAERREHE